VTEEGTATVEAQYEVGSWSEVPIHEDALGPKLTKATVAVKVSGPVDGAATMEYLMAYPTETTSTFIGIARFDGAIDGRSGQFVATIAGSFAGSATERWTVVEDSGTGGLAGISGTADVSSIDTTHARLTLAYRLP
jgi:hypothetical protein